MGNGVFDGGGFTVASEITGVSVATFCKIVVVDVGGAFIAGVVACFATDESQATKSNAINIREIRFLTILLPVQENRYFFCKRCRIQRRIKPTLGVWG